MEKVVFVENFVYINNVYFKVDVIEWLFGELVMNENRK